MSKIIEGIYCFKQGQDQIISKTQGLSSNEDIVRSSHLFFANLSSFNPDINKSLYSYSSSPIFNPENKLEQRVLITRHINNIDHDVSGRGQLEVVHYVHVPTDFNYRNVELINSDIFKKDLSDYVLSSERIDLPLIEQESFKSIEGDFISRKEEIIHLLDNIIYSFIKGKSLYIIYNALDIDDFHQDFFKALSLLPVAICNSLSFITCYGGGASSRYQIIGVPMEESDLARSNLSNSGLIYRYPYNEMLSNSDISNNPLHQALIDIEDSTDLDRFLNFVSKNYVPSKNPSLNEFLDFITLYNSLFSSQPYRAGEEYVYISCFNKNLAFLINHIDIINRFDNQTLSSLVTALTNSVSELQRIVISQMVVKSINETFDLLKELYLKAGKDSFKKDVLEELIYPFLFAYEAPEDKFMFVRAELVRRAIEDPALSNDLIAYIVYNDNYYNSSLLMVDSWTNLKECQISYLVRLYYFIYSIYRNNTANEQRVVAIIAKLLDLISINDIGLLLFHNNDDLEVSFLIICNLLLYLAELDSQKQQEVMTFVINYLYRNNLVLYALNSINPDHFSNAKAIVDLREAIVDSFIGGDINTYEDLCVFMNKIASIDPNTYLFKEIKDRLIEHHLNQATANSIRAKTIRSITQNDQIFFSNIIYYLQDSVHEVPKNIIEAIYSVLAQAQDYHASVSREEDLVNFRMAFVLRAAALLPEKDSRPIVYEYIGKDKAEPLIGKHLHLSREEYANALVKLVADFLKDRGQEGIRNNEMISKHSAFVKAIFAAQNKKRFNIHTIATVAECIFNMALFGGIGLLLSALGSFLIYTNVTNKSYLSSLMILSIAIAALSAISSLVNVYNKGRRKIYLVSALETISLVIVGLGLFTLLVFLLGGK